MPAGKKKKHASSLPSLRAIYQLMLKMIILPRQARDKHRENSKRDAFSYSTILTCMWRGCLRPVRNRRLLFCAIFILIKNPSSFYQDRLGTNTGKTLKRAACFLCRAAGWFGYICVCCRADGDDREGGEVGGARDAAWSVAAGGGDCIQHSANVRQHYSTILSSHYVDTSTFLIRQ